MEGEREPEPFSWRRWLDPVPALALIMLLGVVALIATSMFRDFDEADVLFRMSGPEYARGLITFLFSMVTIGTAVVLVVAVLVGDAKDGDLHKRVQSGKDVLGLLLGVFGTIVGFYFGTELTSKSATTPGPQLSVTTPYVTAAPHRVVAKVGGGLKPIRYLLEVGDGDDPDVRHGKVAESGWIDIALPPDSIGETPLPVVLRVFDDAGKLAVVEHELDPPP